MNTNILSLITKREKHDLIIAWLAIAIAFTIVFIRKGTIIVEPSGINFLLLLIISVLTVGLGFVLHELAHKFTAIKYGYWAEFRRDNQMLVIAVALAALVMVVFAAPGATVIYSRDGRPMTKEENGIISAAGPVVNLILCVPFLLLIILGAVLGTGLLPVLIAAIGFVGMSVNSMIAFFNLLPVSVLDGKKVLSWNPAVFAVLIVASLAMILISQDYGGILESIVKIFA